MSPSDPRAKNVSRRTFAQLSSSLPLGLTLPGSGLASMLVKDTVAAASTDQYLNTRDQVPDPDTVVFTVEYPGKAPLKLVGHRWYNAAARARGQTCPAIVEILPYRRRDGTMAMDSKMHPWLAYNEYLCYRVDLQGSGDSEGIMSDEYSEEELLYCVQIINAIAAQPECNGKVGMTGISWGAINTLMVAAREDCPAALKAILISSGTDDRFHDDVHYMGGALQYDNASWPTFMWRWLALPPDPAIVGDAWQELWRQRIRQADFWFKQWASHQTRDSYWSATSVREHYERIKVPVFVSSGWQDAYRNQVGRLLAGLTQAGIPARGILGAWGHAYPFAGDPGPRLDWLHYTVTHWWDPWLKGKPAPPASEWPQLLVWLGEAKEPDPSPCAEDQGRWVAEDAHWAERVIDRPFYLAANHSLSDAPAEGTYVVPSKQVIHTEMLETGSLGACGNSDLPGDQTVADEQSLTFDSEPFKADFDCFGMPSVTLNVTCSGEQAVLAVRLCEVNPATGASHLVSYRFFNLCYRDGDYLHPQPIKPGRPFSVRLPLNMMGHSFKKGWHLRLALSSSLFPTLWPSAVTPDITIHAGRTAEAPAAVLTLPQRAPRDLDLAMPDLLRPSAGSPSVNSEDYVPTLQVERLGGVSNQVEDVTIDGKPGVRVQKLQDFGRYLLGGPLDRLWVDHVSEESFHIIPEDPSSMTAESRGTSVLERPSSGWHIKVETATKIWSEAHTAGWDFRYTASIHAYIVNSRGEDELFEERQVEGRVPRQWV